MKFNNLPSAVFLSCFSVISNAGPSCAEEQTSQWLSEEDMKAKISEMGYSFDKFKISRGKCYEIYGHNKNGQKVEVYFDPVSGEIVEEEIES